MEAPGAPLERRLFERRFIATTNTFKPLSVPCPGCCVELALHANQSTPTVDRTLRGPISSLASARSITMLLLLLRPDLSGTV